MASWRVPLQNGGEIWVNASDAQAALENAHQGGNTPSGAAPSYAGGVGAPAGTPETSGTRAGSSGDASTPGYASTSAPPATPAAPAAPGAAPSKYSGAFPTYADIQQGYEFDPDNPARAFRNALRQSGMPTSFLARGSNSSMGRYLTGRAAPTYYQFLTDQARGGGNITGEEFGPYLMNAMRNGFNGGNDLGGRLGYMRQLSDRLPSDLGQLGSQFAGNPAELALAALMMTQSPTDLVDLMLGQYGGALSPGLVGGALRPLAQAQADVYDDTGQDLRPGGGNVFKSLRNFFLGR